MSLVKACERLESGDDTLCELELEEVDARLVRALSRPSFLESLSFIDIELDIDLADALAKQTQLTKLFLWKVRLAASHLATALRELTQLQQLTLAMDNVDEDGVKCVLAAVGELPELLKLVLVGQAMTGRIRAVSEAAVAHGRLRELGLSDCAIGDDGAVHVATMLERNRSLTVLTLRCNLGDAGLERLGRCLTRNPRLRHLDLYGNRFTAEGVAGFADMMGDMHGLLSIWLDNKWEHQLLPGIECNYSLLELPRCPAAQPYLGRNARSYAKARAATLAWLCSCRYRRPFGLLPEIGLIIARLIYASRGQSCWAPK